MLIDKPGGITSHDAVAAVRRALRTRKVGHAGTLDPMATGLLVIGVGRATRLLRFLGDLPKVYEGTMRLGVETTTLDAEGEVLREAPVDADDGEIAAAMAAKLGASAQRPPAFSAVKVGGRKLYEAARKGEMLEAPARIVRVDRFVMTGRDGADVSFACTVSGGTYVRVLAADVGAALGCGAHLTALRRTAIGPFAVETATTPDEPGAAAAAGARRRAPAAVRSRARGGDRRRARADPRARRDRGTLRRVRPRRPVDRRLPRRRPQGPPAGDPGAAVIGRVR